MELIKIKGQTYYIPAPTNVGVYSFRNGFCALIDSGADNPAGKKIIESLEKHQLKVKYILHTHAHPDHFGADGFIRSTHTGTTIYASPLTKIFMENSQLEPFTMYGAAPLKQLNGKVLKGRDTKVDFELSLPQTDCGGKKFEILSLPGHSIDQVGVVTPDGVGFFGDALFSEDIIAKYNFPFCVDLEAQLKTLALLEGRDDHPFVLGHGEVENQGVRALVDVNRDNLWKHLGTVKELLSEPLTREDVAERLIQLEGLDVSDLQQYFITLVSVGAFISFLANRGEVTEEVLDGKLYFFAN